MMQKQKISCILASILCISFVLGGCSKKTNSKWNEESTFGTDSVTTQAETENQDPLFYLEAQDFNGYEFRFLTIDQGINGTTRFTDEIAVEEADGDVINDAVFLRNQMVEQKLNVKIVALPTTNIFATAKKSTLAGDDTFDVCNMVKAESLNMTQENLLKDWNTLPIVDFSRPWWNGNCVDKLTVKGFLPLMSGSILISEIDDTLAMVFNKQLATDYNVEDLYDLVKEKKWTIDKMTAIIKDISKDLNGDGKNRVGDDIFGYVQDPASMTYNWCFSSNLMNGFVDDDGIWQPNVDIDRTQTLVDKMSHIFGDTPFAYTGTDLYEGLTFFQENKIFLYAIILRNVELLRNMEVDFGVLPYPLLDENQENYSTHIGGASPILAIPITNKEDTRTGSVLEAMAAASHAVVRPAYYDMALKVKGARDEQSGEMLDIILKSSTYDISYFSGNSLINIVTPLLAKGKTEFASSYEKSKNQLNKNMQKYVDKIVASLRT